MLTSLFSNPILNAIFLSLIEIYGDFFLKFYAQSGGLWNLSNGLFGYSTLIFVLIKSFSQFGVGFQNLLWDSVSALLETLAAIFILGESFNHWYQYVAICMIVSGIFLLKWGGTSKL